MIDVQIWKQQWDDNAQRSGENSMRDTGWSADTASACVARGSDLQRQILRQLATVQLTPADMFDRPELAACCELARHVVRED